MSRKKNAKAHSKRAKTSLDAALPAFEATGAEIASEPARAATDAAASRADLAQAAAEAATRRVEESLNSRELLDQILARWQNTSTGQLAGRLGEFHPTATFNMNAAEIAEAVRARITEYEVLGDPHSPSDVLLTDASGNILADYQSKVISSVAQRLHDIAQPKYDDVTGFILPSDHVGPTVAKIDARIAGADPDFLARPAYESARERITATLVHGDVSSDPVTHEELLDAARNPRQYGDGLVQRERDALAERSDDLASQAQAVRVATVLQVGSAAVGGACAAAVATSLLEGLRCANGVRNGEMSTRQALAHTAHKSGRAAVQGGYVGAVGQGLMIAAQHELLPAALAGGPLPFYVARATWDVAATSVLLARGEIDPREAAARTAESLARLTCSYAGMLVGQALIPIPILGGLVGATAGALCASVVVDALSGILAARKELELAKEELKVLKRQVTRAVAALDAETASLRAYARQQAEWYAAAVVPELDGLDAAVARNDYETAISCTEAVIIAFGGTPRNQTRQEFVRWAANPASRLVLDPNPVPVPRRLAA